MRPHIRETQIWTHTVAPSRIAVYSLFLSKSKPRHTTGGKYGEIMRVFGKQMKCCWINFYPHISISPNKREDLIIWAKKAGKLSTLKRCEVLNESGKLRMKMTTFTFLLQLEIVCFKKANIQLPTTPTWHFNYFHCCCLCVFDILERIYSCSCWSSNWMSENQLKHVFDYVICLVHRELSN